LEVSPTANLQSLISMPPTPLTPSQLRNSCDPDAFNFETTADLPIESDIIGQPRGARAIEFGIDIDSPGYNIFVLGEEGTGRTTAIGRFLRERAELFSTPAASSISTASA